MTLLLSSTVQYVTKFMTISLYLTKLYVIRSFAITLSVKHSEIRPNFLTVYPGCWNKK